MNIFITGSQFLTDYDRKEIANYLEFYAPHHTIHLMCYRSLEHEVLKFYIENDHLAKNLRIYTFQSFTKIDRTTQETIDYLIHEGAAYKSFNINEEFVRRSVYESVWEEVLRTEAELVISFYNQDKPSALIPIDVAKSLKIDAAICPLPGTNKQLLKLPFEEKIRVV